MAGRPVPARGRPPRRRSAPGQRRSAGAPVAYPLTMASGATRLLTGALGHGGLLALAVLPIPPEVVLPFAGFHVGLGQLGFFSSWAIATGASVLAALPLYVLARTGGRPLLLRHGRLLGVNARRIDRAERWVARWGAGLVLFGRIGHRGAQRRLGVGRARTHVARPLLALHGGRVRHVERRAARCGLAGGRALAGDRAPRAARRPRDHGARGGCPPRVRPAPPCPEQVRRRGGRGPEGRQRPRAHH